MPRGIGTRACIAVGVIALASVHCTRKAADAAPSASSAPPPASTTAAPARSTAPVASATPAIDARARLAAYFARFVDGTSFDFLRDEWAARVERYLRLADVPVDDLVSSACSFYRDRHHVKLTVDPASVASREQGGRTFVSFVVTMAWSQPAPASARACGHVDDSMQWHAGSSIDHKAAVNAEMTLDASGKFVAYDEHGLKTRHMVVKSGGDPLKAYAYLPGQPARNLEEDAGGSLVPDGTVVDDLGDSFTCAQEGAEIDTVEKVRFGGRDVWLLSSWAASTGHSFVGEDVLVPAP